MPSLFTLPLYRLTFIIVLALWATPDVIDSIRRRPRGNNVVFREHGSHWLFRIGLTLAIATAIWLALARPEGTLPYHRPTLFIAGVVVALAGLVLRRAAVHTLGRFFTVDVATYTDQRVVEAPPYRRVRHPGRSFKDLSRSTARFHSARSIGRRNRSDALAYRLR